jgi:hypothetical protein
VLHFGGKMIDPVDTGESRVVLPLRWIDRRAGDQLDPLEITQ